MKVTLLLNIARAYFEFGDFMTSRRACTTALTVEPANAKALFWRAKGLVSPASSGALELEEAIRYILLPTNAYNIHIQARAVPFMLCLRCGGVVNVDVNSKFRVHWIMTTARW